MSYSTQRVVSDGSLVLLSVSIGYLERAHIKVFFDNLENDTLWDWVGTTDNQIAFTPAVPNGVEVLVARSTDLSAPYHVFSQGAQFTAESLDEDISQILYIAQEATEQSLTAEFFQDVNMHGFKITNVADAADPQDVMTLGQATGFMQPYADAAATSASEALAYRDAAAVSAAASAASAISAAASAAAAAGTVVGTVNAGSTNAVLQTSATGSMRVPAGSTAQRPVAPTVGDTRVNTTTNKDEVWLGATWVSPLYDSDTGVAAGSIVKLDGSARLPALDASLLTNVPVCVIADNSITPAKLTQKLTLGTAQATTSGTSKDFTGIPSWVKRITVMFSTFSTNGGSFPLVQIGDAGGIETTAYDSTGTHATSGVSSTNSTSGFIIDQVGDAGVAISGVMTLVLLDATTNTWVASGCFGGSGSYAQTAFMGGAKSLSATLDRIRLTTVNGTDTFDAGSVNIMYE